MKRLILTLQLLVVAAGVAEAHTGHGAGGGFQSGFSHPFSGLDHLAAMVAVGLLASLPGGLGWRAPAAFVAAMAAGFLHQAFGAHVLSVSVLVAGSALALGLLLALGRAAPMLLVLAAVAACGFGHGYVHGMEAGDAALADYGAGFMAASVLLHAGGYALALAAGVPRSDLRRLAAAGVVAAAGLVLALPSVV